MTPYKSIYKENENDYKGEHTAPDKESGSPLYDLTLNGTYPEDIYSSKAKQYYSTGSSYDSITISMIQYYKDKPKSSITIYRAVPKIKKSLKINKGDWVSITKQYAKDHGESVLNDYKIISKKVKAKDIYTNGDSIHEWGYDP